MGSGAGIGEKGALGRPVSPSPRATPVKGLGAGPHVLRPARRPPGPGYLVLRENEAGCLCVSSLPPRGRTEEIPVVLPRSQEALLLFLVKLGTRRGKGCVGVLPLRPTLHSRRQTRLWVLALGPGASCLTFPSLERSHSFQKYLMSTYYEPGPFLSHGDTAMNKQNSWDDTVVGETDNEQTDK